MEKEIKIFKSASITFFDKIRGFLLCKEDRDRKLLYHPIGGKYEPEDVEIHMTAAREFVEETGILKCAEFISYLQKSSFYQEYKENKNNLSNHKNKNINSYVANHIFDALLLNSDISYYYDYYVNKDRNFVHRYYLVNLDFIDANLAKIIQKIDLFYKNTFITCKNEYIDSLVWNKEIIKNKRLHKNEYSMLTIYLSLFLRNTKIYPSYNSLPTFTPFKTLFSSSSFPIASSSASS